MSRVDHADPSEEGPHSSATSRGLLERVKVDDAAAWHRLVDLYAPLVYRWCRGFGLPEPDAADVFQDVFQAVASSIACFRKEKEGDTFRGWLRTITRNKIRDHFRIRGREPAGEGGTRSTIPDLRSSGRPIFRIGRLGRGSSESPIIRSRPRVDSD